MNTDEPTNQAPQADMPDNAPAEAPEPAPAPPSDPITGLVDDMQGVNTDAPQASQNETTISDNNGDRMELGEGGTGDNVIRK